MDLSNITISEFRTWINKRDNLPEEVIDSVFKDQRLGIKKAYGAWKNKQSRLEIERNHLQKIKEKDEIYYSKGYKLLAGVDEAGRGPLAGPVVAAAVILPRESHIDRLNDSKKLSAKLRCELFRVICDDAICIGIGLVSAKEIDRVGMGKANKKAIIQALDNLKYKPEYVLIDGLYKPNGISGEGLIKGDSNSYCIAAASIIAKVTRDRIMYKLSHKYPHYKFDIHKGYGTSEHIKILKQNGLSPVHRRSFCNSILQEGTIQCVK